MLVCYNKRHSATDVRMPFIMPQLAKAKVFSTVDARDGF